MMYPVSPPRQFNIKSSTSQLPTIVISCVSSIAKERLNEYKFVAINLIINDIRDYFYDRYKYIRFRKFT